MKKRTFGRKLNRTKNERRALFRSLMRALVLDERIQTTEAKAKAIKGELEKLVTKAIKKGDAAEYDLKKYFDPEVVRKIIKDIAPRFVNRPGGYTRIIHTGVRMKDNASKVMMEWVTLGAKGPLEIEKKKKKGKTEKVEVKASSSVKSSEDEEQKIGSVKSRSSAGRKEKKNDNKTDKK